ncbi:MAG: NYN domain-containing protein [Bacteroidales bacterium]|nr:NYN domain-containing protein [Bacteroidales bacterium]
MGNKHKTSLVRIGVFYDGNYFLHVSNYYNYVHSRQSRISISGLHNFIRHYVAQEEGIEAQYCQIVDAHYFRSRPGAKEANTKSNQLYFDRLFDDILMSEGIITHYFPARNVQGVKMEKGIDVWLALEAYDLSIARHYDVLVLIASDGDYVPLVKKINALGTKVMLINWDFEFVDDFGQQKMTRTSQDLLREVTYPIALHDLIEDPDYESNELINGLFVPKSEKREYDPDFIDDFIELEGDGIERNSTILSLKNGYGFIKYPPNNLFFHYHSLLDTDISDLNPGDEVIFEIAKNEKNEDVAVKVRAAK